MNKSDLIGIVAILLIVIGGGCVIYYYIVYEFGTCTKDPLKYAFDEEIGDEINYSYVDIRFYTNKWDIAPIKTIEFDIKEKA